MKHYLLKLLLFFSPILLVVAIYVVLDPFMVVWHYDDYRVEDRAVFINRAYVSSRVFENQNDTCHYDSFIFGNSTSLNYYVADWQRYIGTGTHPFHFDAMNGSVEGIYLKVGFIDEHHALSRTRWSFSTTRCCRKVTTAAICSCNRPRSPTMTIGCSSTAHNS